MHSMPTPLNPGGSVLLTALLLIIFPGCLDTGKPCCEYLDTETIAKGLYVERYRTYCAGVFGESITSYLTDSLHFRQVIGGNDEHGTFHVQVNGNEIKTFNTETSFYSDTVEIKTISKTDLLKYHHSDTACVGISPIFGKNTIQCDSHLSPDSYKTDDGNYITSVQYHCGNDYLDAIFYTDSKHFRVLLGVCEPGGSPYSGKLNTNSTCSFYRTNSITKVDTIDVRTFLISDLEKGKLMKPCERRK